MVDRQKDILIQALANAELRYQTGEEGEIPAYVGELKPAPGGWEEGYIFWRTQYMRRNPLFKIAVHFFREYQAWRKEQKAKKADPYVQHIGLDAITLLTDVLYHDPFVAMLEPMPVEEIFKLLDNTPKKYPTQKGLLFHKSMPFRAGFLNFSDAPHSLQMRIDYTKPVSHILRYVATHVHVAQDLIKEVPLAEIYDAIATKDKLGDQTLSVLFTEDENFPVSYNQSSDIGRAIGLWLWEEKQRNPEAQKTDLFTAFAIAMPDKDKDYKELSGYLRCAKACIEAMQVLASGK